MKKFLVAIDQGTTSSRAILFSLSGKSIYTSQKEFKQYFPKNGWVEHNPNEIWSTVKKVLLDVITKSKKAIAGFKIREKLELGVTVTLRSEKMFAFLDKLINLTLPQIRDFRGLSSKGFDKNGNYNLGLTEQLIFPEIEYDDIDQMRGLDINIVTTGKTKMEGKALLTALGFPFND